MFEDYKRDVLNYYMQNRGSGVFSDRLINPTPAKLREECLIILAHRYLEKDSEVIKNFFDPYSKFENHFKSINNVEVDRFRPLIKFIKGEIKTTDDKNIKLLAWLIDYEPRPYRFEVGFGERENDLENIAVTEKSQGDEPAETTVIESPISSSETIKIDHDDTAVRGDSQVEKGDGLEKRTLIEPENPAVKTGGQGGRLPIKSRLVFSLLLLTMSSSIGAVYWVKKGTEKCMYWTGDHYEQVSCESSRKVNPIIALDQQKVSHFKKINRPDTITSNAIDRIWYSKIDNEVEFFTGRGHHPVKTYRVLKPLTFYMWKKYGTTHNLSNIQD